MWYCRAKWLTKLCPSGWDRYHVSCSFVLGPRHFRKKYVWIDSWQIVRTFLFFNDVLVSSTPALPVNIFTWKKEKPCSPGQRKFSCAGNVKKAVSLIRKTTTQHVHHAFLYISFPSLHNYNVKWPNFELTWERERQGDKLYYLSGWTRTRSPLFSSKLTSLFSSNWVTRHKGKKVSKNGKSIFQRRLHWRRCCGIVRSLVIIRQWGKKVA